MPDVCLPRITRKTFGWLWDVLRPFEKPSEFTSTLGTATIAT